ncbi:Gfo/Idh/MocA family protein [Ornithinibacillus sp. 4-3]|uniref:Gfo/Idh/MocA family protein n=1 Tax=Ornithinibacillus sp. 4-3 TaxID=3231488 RepID=A0AB39HJG0_9BACI
MGKLNIGIIGLGAVGERLIKQFIAHPETEIVAICDVSVNRMNEIRETYVEATSYEDHRDLIHDDRVELVYVAVPPKFHHGIALDVMAAGKNILCEKPLANTYEEAKDMAEKAAEAGVMTAMNFPLPYTPPVQLFEEKLNSGIIGKLRRIDFKMHFTTWPRAWQQNPWIAKREQGGYIREVMPHYLQFIQQIFGKVTNVNSFIDYPDNEEDCEIGIIARLELEDGTPILVNGLSNIAKQEDVALRAYGEKGVLSLLNWGTLTFSSLDQEEEVLSHRDREAKMLLVDELVKAAKGEPAHLIDFQEGYEVQAVLEKLLGKN